MTSPAKTFGDFTMAMKMRDVIKAFIASELRSSGMLPVYGTVRSINGSGHLAQVLINGESNPVWVNMNAEQPAASGQVVRILGQSGDLYIDAVVSGAPRVVATLGAPNAVAATTPGTVVKKLEVFDAAGTSLGFVAVYNTIT